VELQCRSGRKNDAPVASEINRRSRYGLSARSLKRRIAPINGEIQSSSGAKPAQKSKPDRIELART
jgi:hypothetical protein